MPLVMRSDARPGTARPARPSADFGERQTRSAGTTQAPGSPPYGPAVPALHSGFLKRYPTACVNPDPEYLECALPVIYSSWAVVVVVVVVGLLIFKAQTWRTCGVICGMDLRQRVTSNDFTKVAVQHIYANPDTITDGSSFHCKAELQLVFVQVVNNPHIRRVYNAYWEAFNRMRDIAPIQTAEDNAAFTQVLRRLVDDHGIDTSSPPPVAHPTHAALRSKATFEYDCSPSCTVREWVTLAAMDQYSAHWSASNVREIPC